MANKTLAWTKGYMIGMIIGSVIGILLTFTMTAALYQTPINRECNAISNLGDGTYLFKCKTEYADDTFIDRLEKVGTEAYRRATE